MKASRAAVIVAINLAVLLIAAEAAGLIVYYYQHGWLFYAAPFRQTYTAPADTRPGQLTRTGLHPYFGQVHAPALDVDIPAALQRPGTPQVAERTNNFGFESNSDYPMARASADQYFVGLFGGSVAQQFCQVGVPRLFAQLGARPEFQGRQLVPVCFAHEGYKQPQQAILLAYFLSIGQPLDLVINIDGFNEVAIGNINDSKNWHPSMPSAMHLESMLNLINQATLTPEKLESLTAISRARQRLDAVAGWLDRTPFASVFVPLELYYRRVDSGYRAELVRFQQLPSNPPETSAVHITPRTQPPGPGVMETIARDWMAASLLMHDMLAARRVPYVHLLQPNQYYSTRVFSDEERAVAFTTETQFRGGAEAGYPLLEKVLAETKAARPEVKLLNGLQLFDQISAPVYVDNCCHYTLAGYDVVADYLAGAILASR